MEEVNNKLSSLIEYIKSSHDYRKCLEIKKQMNDNAYLMGLINDVKKLQKKYILSNYDESIEMKLNEKKKELMNIPIYVMYNHYLDNVNNMIVFVQDSLNNYFNNLLN